MGVEVPKQGHGMFRICSTDVRWRTGIRPRVHGDGTVQSTSIQYILKDSGYRRRRCEVYPKGRYGNVVESWNATGLSGGIVVSMVLGYTYVGRHVGRKRRRDFEQ